LVTGWEEGYFFLEGFAPSGWAHDHGPMPELDALIAVQVTDAASEAFSPNGVIDGRQRAMASIVRRRGQPEFRRKLIKLYSGRCAISGCEVVEVLEAAHIVPYRGPATNDPSNGLLLRADLHTLFDLGMLAIDPSAMTVLISPRLGQTSYEDLAGKPIRLPQGTSGQQPSVEALEQHRKWSGL